jgi:integrase
MPRAGVWYADGRSNNPNPGRHSLNTRDLAEARNLVPKLDLKRAVYLRLATAPASPIDFDNLLTLEEGRRLYEKHIGRPLVAGGVKASTAKRYRTVFDKFLKFAKTKRVSAWNDLGIGVLHDYAAHLESNGYASKTIRNELVTLAQVHKWLLAEKHLIGEPIRVRLRKVESERPYCYTTAQVAAMVAHCRANPSINWLGNVIVALATTGLRISELASLKWSDFDLRRSRLTLTDETGQSGTRNKNRRQLKSGRSRSLPVHPDLAAILTDIPRHGPHVFQGPRRGRLKPDTVRQVLIREVLTPLAKRFPTVNGEKGFIDGRLHSFRHYFASRCAQDSQVSEYETMNWLGHADSAMVRHYFHLHDEESQRRMSQMDLLGEAGKPLPGLDGAAIKDQEATGQESNSQIAT